MKPGDDFGRAGLLLFAGRVSRCVIRGRRTLSRRSNARTGVVRTHPTNHLILPGITRAIVLDMARGFGIPVSEEPIAETDIPRLDELFIAGTTTDVMPIVRVDDRPVGAGNPGPITTRLVKEFRAYLDASCAAAHARRRRDEMYPPSTGLRLSNGLRPRRTGGGLANSFAPSVTRTTGRLPNGANFRTMR